MHIDINDIHEFNTGFEVHPSFVEYHIVANYSVDVIEIRQLWAVCRQTCLQDRDTSENAVGDEQASIRRKGHAARFPKLAGRIAGAPEGARHFTRGAEVRT